MSELITVDTVAVIPIPIIGEDVEFWKRYEAKRQKQIQEDEYSNDQNIKSDIKSWMDNDDDYWNID